MVYIGAFGQYDILRPTQSENDMKLKKSREYNVMVFWNATFWIAAR